jgi:hypothetical protein
MSVQGGLDETLLPRTGLLARHNFQLARNSSGFGPDDQIQPDQYKGACRVIPRFATFNIEAKYLLDL